MSDEPAVDVAAVRARLLADCGPCAAVRDVLAALDQLQRENERLTKLVYIGEHHFPDLTWKARAEEAHAGLAAAQAASVTERKLTNDYIRQLHVMQAQRDAAKAALAQAEQERDAQRKRMELVRDLLGDLSLPFNVRVGTGFEALDGYLAQPPAEDTK